jgi:hypothetical protein
MARGVGPDASERHGAVLMVYVTQFMTTLN